MDWKWNFQEYSADMKTHISNNRITTNVSTANDGKMLILILTSVLVYFISYFFIYIERDSFKMITLDYITALISLLPVIVTIGFFTKVKKV